MPYAFAYAIRIECSEQKWLAPALTFVVVAFLAYSLPPYFTGGTRCPPRSHCTTRCWSPT